MKNSPIEPCGDRVVIQVIEEEEQMYGNIVVPDMGNEKPVMGEVLAVGPGRLSPEGKIVKPEKQLIAGTKVLVPVFGAQKVSLNNEEYIIASANDILGIIKTEKNE
jgi:chaperonin GroES